MSLLRFVRLVLLTAPLASPLAAQERWNDEQTLALVRSAIVQRSAQLADTALRDYRARAHGYVTFLAQFGEGFPLPPAVVKSDELMVEVLWQAPDRSAQRIIGRRDTLLLPTDMNYHRDHLGVVQNNFPSIIRLGDGDEVRDVAHPLSTAGLALYDYRLSDSLAIRSGTQAIDVLMIQVRPKDDRQAAAVGAVHLDRANASVVRMTLSFTRAALKDPQLEDVSVILENGLVEGRFWLPRRQEIEIRRTATWMDFPARGIIRGRWEITDVEPNITPAPDRFMGPEITEVPRQLQRTYPFEGEILRALPEAIRTLDDAEVREVQEAARQLVRAGALARVGLARPAARRVSDLLRVNRVEGFAAGAGLSQTLGSGFTVSMLGRFGTADHRWKGSGALTWRSPREAQWNLEWSDDFGEAGGLAEVSGLRNSLAAQEFGSDWTDPYGLERGRIRYTSAPRERDRWSIELARERHRPLAVAATPATGRYEPTLAADQSILTATTLGWIRAPAAEPSAPQLSGNVHLTLARTDAGATPATALVRLSAELEARHPAGAGLVVARTLLHGITGGAGVPVQWGAFAGGPLSAPGYAFHALRGDAMVAQRVEWHRRAGSVPVRFGRFGAVPTTVTVAPYVHQTMIHARDGAGWTSAPSVGLGVIGLFDLLRFDVARPLRGRGWLVTLDVARAFWPAL
ncbi:MAG: hypothetical protein FJ362_00940 [Gemmatimonadetes bacterium]|nr:hypothetical protein [Gemmatimonadota bacterium]